MKTSAILMAMLLVFSVMPMVVAQDEVSDSTDAIVDAGVTPDSAFYGLERAMERLRLAFMTNKANKALYKVRLAEERMAEADVMLEEDNLEAAQEAQELHDEILEEAQQEAEEIESNDGEEVAEEALTDVEEVQLRLALHSERVAEVHNRILERMRLNNASESQLSHIGEVFAKIQTKAQEMEQKVSEKREKVRTRYKVLSELSEDELEEREKAFLERVQEMKQNREEIKEAIQEKKQLKVHQDASEDSDSEESEDSGNQQQSGQE